MQTRSTKRLSPFKAEANPSNKEFYLESEKAFSKANTKAKYSNNIWKEIWRNKYAFINVFSGVTSAGDLTTDQIDANEATKKRLPTFP